jgi:hypothetical protein
MTSETIATPMLADWRDLLALTKPRVMTLVVFTGLCGLAVAPVALPPVLAFTAILCIALGAGAADRGGGGATSGVCTTPVLEPPHAMVTERAPVRAAARAQQRRARTWSSMSSGRVLIKPAPPPSGKRRGRKRRRAPGDGCDLRRRAERSSIAQFFHNHRVPQVEWILGCLVWRTRNEQGERTRAVERKKLWHCEW